MRKLFLLTISLLLFIGSINVFSQTKVFKLLIIDSQVGEPYQSARESLLKTLEAAGYNKGKNLEITIETIGNDQKKAEEVIKANINKNFDVIFANGTVVTIAAKNTAFNDKQKFVFACVTDPVGVGVIKDFKTPPFANFTGVSFPVPVKSRLKFVKELLPKAKTFGLIYADMPQSVSYKKWVEEILQADPDFKDTKVIFKPIELIKGDGGSEKMAAAAVPMIKQLDSQVDAFIAPNDQMGVQKYLGLAISTNSKKPFIGLGLKDVMEEWGAVASIYPSYESMGEQSAKMIIEIFKGKAIKDIMPEWPKKSGFSFNLKKAKTYGITVPAKLIELAGKNIVN